MKKDSEKIRLQKAIADSSAISRRKAEDLIVAGKVTVNGKIITKLGSKASPGDTITVNGKTLRTQTEKVTIMLNKPANVITSKSDPHHKHTVMGLLPKQFIHLKPAGRLDKESEGLLILSSDGDLIQKLTHPSNKHIKTYEVLVKGNPVDEHLAALESGKLKLDNYPLNPMGFKILKKVPAGRGQCKTWIRLQLSEGRKRQIRRVMDMLGFPVVYLRRTQIGKLDLGDLEKGDFKILTPEEIALTLA